LQADHHAHGSRTQQGVNKQCFADGDAAGSSGVTGAAPRAADPVVRIERTGARPIDAMSAWATTGGPRTASLVASGRVTRMRVLRNLQLEPSHAVDTCVQRITPPHRPAPADMGGAVPPAVSRRWSPVASLLVQRALLRVRRWRGPAQRAGNADEQRQLACCWSAVGGLAMVSPIRTAEYQARHLRLALAARSPRHIAFGMAFEATTGAFAGPPATRAHALLDEARSWAAQVDERLADAYVAMAEGAVAFLCGRWRDSLARCDAAQRAFRDECVGVAWEIGTANQVSLSCLLHMGHIGELRPRLTRALDEADRRGDLYAATALRTALHPVVCLMDDREDRAREALARAQIWVEERRDVLGLVRVIAIQPYEAAAVLEHFPGRSHPGEPIEDRGSGERHEGLEHWVIDLRGP
jgi:hypothetical protein